MRLAAIWMPEYLLAPALKDLGSEPPAGLALVDGERRGRPVRACTERARKGGLHVGMEAEHARAMVEGLVLVELDWERLEEERTCLEEGLRVVTPDLEHERPGLVFARIEGVLGRYRSEEKVAKALLEAAWQSGHKASVGLAGTRLAAELAARRARRGGRDVEVVAVGADAQSMAGESVRVLEDEHLAERLLALGVENLGELAALPAEAFGQRYGSEAAWWRALVSGEERSAWNPCREPVDWTVRTATPGPVRQLEGLRFVLRAALGRLCGSLAGEARAMGGVSWKLFIEGGEPMVGSTHSARPSASARLWNELLMSAFGRLKAGAPILGVELRALGVDAEEGRQLHLLGSREAQPGALDRALARVTAALGEGSYGRLQPQRALWPEQRTVLAPELPRSIEERAPPWSKKRGRAKRKKKGPTWRGSEVERWLADEPAVGSAGSLLRLLKEPAVVEVQVRQGRPERWYRRQAGRPWIADAWAGPWDVSGLWWEEEQKATRRYWLLGQRGGWSLLRNQSGAWYLDGFVD